MVIAGEIAGTLSKGSTNMASVQQPGGSLTRRKRIGLGILGLVIAVLIAGPPDFAPFMVISGWSNELDGGAHQLHYVMRGVGSVVTLFIGLVLILKPTWAIGAAQVALATGLAYPAGALLGQHVYPPAIIYPIIGAIVVAVVYLTHRDRLPWKQPAAESPAPSLMILGATAIIAVPLVAWGLNEAAMQRGPEFVHGDLGHWASGAAFAVKFILMGLLASLKWPGWRVPAWSAAFSIFMLGLASLLMPNQASSVGEVWGVIAMLGGLGFLAVAELEGRLFTRPTVQPAG
jgi:hypothetical protein